MPTSFFPKGEEERRDASLRELRISKCFPVARLVTLIHGNVVEGVLDKEVGGCIIYE